MSTVTFTTAELQALAKLVAPLIQLPSPTPVPTPTPAASVVYQDGQMNWTGDYSYPAPPLTIDYRDTTGAPKSGTYCIKVDPHGAPYGAWQPYANAAGNWDTSPYTSLNFDLKPTDAGAAFQVQFLLAGDKPTGVSVPLSKYGPLQAGVWTTFSIPLADLGVAKTTIYKWACQNIGSAKPWYINNARFQ